MFARIHQLRDLSCRVLRSPEANPSCTRSRTHFLFAMMFLAGCSPFSGAKTDQAEDGQGTYSISTMYDGSVGAKAYTSEWLDSDAKNLCRAPYKLISEKSISNVNHLGEVTSSRLVWTFTCERVAEEPP
ncbi:hypothetical protein SAMN05216299_103166 [Nitrosospira sp. Nsp14]|nr:hypothetical protein SAMN05216299_103166 [Nitrosospira sp. Nsp14]